MKKYHLFQFIIFLTIILSLVISLASLSPCIDKRIKSSSIKLPENDLEINWNNGESVHPDTMIDSLGGLHVVWEDYTNGIWGNDSEIMYISNSGSGWSNTTVISDDGTNWNNGSSSRPSIAVDNSEEIHIVWGDHTEGIWGIDSEIMYVSYTEGDGWSNATVISDGYNDIYWNNGSSSRPSIAGDNTGKVHVVWEDYTDGFWGTDWEIMYVSHIDGFGWSNATVISDGYNSTYWNNDSSASPSIAVDNSGKIQVVWMDETNGIWGTDGEIMYCSSTDGISWLNATVISDDVTKWNNGAPYKSSIVIDNSGKIHVAWEENTYGVWGGGIFDTEIMYTSSNDGLTWSNATVISDGYNGLYWNNGTSSSPSIAVDNSGKIHISWDDHAYGVWGNDKDIMYT